VAGSDSLLPTISVDSISTVQLRRGVVIGQLL